MYRAFKNFVTYGLEIMEGKQHLSSVNVPSIQCLHYVCIECAILLQKRSHLRSKQPKRISDYINGMTVLSNIILQPFTYL